ncbi:histidine--tRNA ligase [Buchnera aphidicola]|nr:histidine--tRNA ligase [Buchnera aphidicola]
MNINIQSIRGIHDYLPKDAEKFRNIENILLSILKSYCFQEIKLPLLEKTDLFYRTIGPSTDVLEKEMYNFESKSNEKISLRPEGTISCVRAVIQHNLLKQNLEQRLWYSGPMFRYERPQKGRYRQFYQLGTEIFGISGEEIELELLTINYTWWKKLGIHKLLSLEINSIGSYEERKEFEKKILLFFRKYESIFDHELKTTLLKNPLRLLDSKNPIIKNILFKAPKLFDSLHQDTHLKFKKICILLKLMKIPFIVNKNLIRGLDYYNDLVFEWTINDANTQNTICAGGRYNLLMSKLGGTNTPSLGCAVGLDRLLLLLNKHKIFDKKNNTVDIYIICLENSIQLSVLKISAMIRKKFSKIRIKIDFSSRKLSKKIKHAVNSFSKLMFIFGKKEIMNNCILVKNLIKHTQKNIPIDQVINYLSFFFKY